jgi:hypothetical protein
MPTPEEIADNTSSQLKPHKYPSIYVGHANGPSHKVDADKAYAELIDLENTPDYDKKVRSDLVDKAFPMSGQSMGGYRLYHGSSRHFFQPGEIVQPTMSVIDSSYHQGLIDDEEHPYDFSRNDPPMAWASQHANYTGHDRTYEVEPLKDDTEYDPHNTETEEITSPTGYRVVQEVTPRKR